jgi:hypothetical protein
MKKEFLIEWQGKTFALYAGLLDLAHERGLQSIRTRVIQFPTQDDPTAICEATVTLLGSDGVERTYMGIADAAPNNVTRLMQTCILRMAETRAKARALRDAVNIGVAAFEELGTDDDPPPAAVPARPPQHTPPPVAAQANTQGDELKERIWAKAEKFGYPCRDDQIKTNRLLRALCLVDPAVKIAVVHYQTAARFPEDIWQNTIGEMQFEDA